MTFKFMRSSKEDDLPRSFAKEAEPALLSQYYGRAFHKTVRRNHSFTDPDYLAWIANLEQRAVRSAQDMAVGEEFNGLSGTSVAALYARDFIYNDGPYLTSPLHRLMADYINAGGLYSKLFIDCHEPYDMGLFLAAREQTMILELERAVHRKEIANIVVLAAGISALPLGLLELIPGVSVWATDLTGIVEKQANFYNFVRATRCNLKMHLPSFEDDDRLKVQKLDVFLGKDWDLVRAQLKVGGVGIICEGLMPYLDLQQWQQVMSAVRSLLAEKGGFFITDIATRKGLKKTVFQHGSARLLRQVYQAAGVSADNIAFADSGEYEAFIATQRMASRSLSLSIDEFVGPVSIDHPSLGKVPTRDFDVVEKCLQQKLAVPLANEDWGKIITAATCRRLTII